MDIQHLIDAAKDQLNRTLSFFTRVDSKASVLFAVNTGMLAVMIANIPPLHEWHWTMLTIVLPIFFLGLSYWHLYREAFPNLEGGRDSLIYFREIANRTESHFIEAFQAQTQEEYLKDLLSQIWRNSEILKEKFDHVRLAFTFVALAIVPWVLSLGLLVSHNSALKSLIAR